jgi:hypothetical protein
VSIIDPADRRGATKLGRRPSAKKAAAVLVMLFVAGAAIGYALSFLAAGGLHWQRLGAFLVGCPLTLLGLISWISMCVKYGRGGLLYGPTTAVLGFGAVLTALAAATSVRRGRRRREAARTVRSGTPTVGTVTGKGYRDFTPRPFGPSTILTVVTFTFVDANNVQRWVRRQMLISSDAPVVDGQTTTIWYDAADPGNESTIVVDLATTSVR